MSRQHIRDKKPKYFLCTDLTLSAETVLTWYQHRWSLEIEYWYLKHVLGLGDFRVQSGDTMKKWYSVVHLTLAFLQWCSYEGQTIGAKMAFCS